MNYEGSVRELEGECVVRRGDEDGDASIGERGRGRHFGLRSEATRKPRVRGYFRFTDRELLGY